jgi:hypothetical protein
MLAEIAEDLVRGVLAKHEEEKTISLLAISVSNLEKHPVVQLELPLALADENRRPGSKRGSARWIADRAVDAVRDRFGWEAVGYEADGIWEDVIPFPTNSGTSLKRNCNHDLERELCHGRRMSDVASCARRPRLNRHRIVSTRHPAINRRRIKH